MLRSTLLATSAILLCATTSYATVTIETTSQPTPGLPDYLTYTYTAVSTEPFAVFDFAGNGNSDPATGKGFFGAMNQVNPLGLPTVFADNNAFFPTVGANVLQDSQFLFKTTDVFTAFNGSENANLLQGVWAWLPSSSPGTTFPFAQIVAPANSSNPIKYRGEIVTRNNGVNTLFRVENFPSVPNLPPVATDSTIGAVANDLINYRFQASDPDNPSDSLIWSNFRFTGPGAALQPTFDPISHDFSWNTAGSAAGTYYAHVQVTDPPGSLDTGRLRINLTSNLPPPPPPPPPVPGSIVISATAIPTPGLPGYQTWTLTATADVGEKIVGFDFVGDGAIKGFFGAMNQVNPVGQPTVYQDNNAIFGFVGADVSQDSQFRVISNTGIHLGDAESGTKLQSAFNYNTANIGLAAQVWDFAQLVIPIAGSGTVPYVGSFTVNNNGVNRLVHVAGTIGVFPEPASFALAGLAMLGMIGFTRRRRNGRSQTSGIIALLSSNRLVTAP